MYLRVQHQMCASMMQKLGAVAKKAPTVSFQTPAARSNPGQKTTAVIVCITLAPKKDFCSFYNVEKSKGMTYEPLMSGASISCLLH